MNWSTISGYREWWGPHLPIFQEELKIQIFKMQNLVVVKNLTTF